VNRLRLLPPTLRRRGAGEVWGERREKGGISVWGEGSACGDPDLSLSFEVSADLLTFQCGGLFPISYVIRGSGLRVSFLFAHLLLSWVVVVRDIARVAIAHAARKREREGSSTEDKQKEC
jgi:hypothetical protein